MTATTWSKFFWSDWESDPSLKMCSPGAQALWMRMLCVCAKADGYLVLAGKALGPADMVGLTGWPLKDIRKWWDELKRWGVFSVEGRGKVYCRRMIKEARKAQVARENGKNGGNPSLRKDSEKSASDNRLPTEGITDLPGRSHIPEARDQKEELTLLSPTGDDAPKGKYPELFERAWKSYPHVKGRSSKPKSLAAWNRLAKAVQTLLPEACARYAKDGREPKLDAGAPAMDRWLRDEKFADWLAAVAAAPALPAIRPFPHDGVRSYVLAQQHGDEAWVRAWLDPCDWDDKSRTILAPRQLTADRLKAEVPGLDRQVSIIIKPVLDAGRSAA